MTEVFSVLMGGWQYYANRRCDLPPSRRSVGPEPQAVSLERLRAAVTARTTKSATEDRDHLIKFIDSGDGIFIVKSAGEAAWQMEGGSWGVIFRGILGDISIW